MNTTVKEWEQNLNQRQIDLDREQAVFNTFKKITFLTERYDKDSTIQLKLGWQNTSNLISINFIWGVINKSATFTEPYDIKKEFNNVFTILNAPKINKINDGDMMLIENNQSGIDKFILATLQTSELQSLYYQLTLDKNITKTNKKSTTNKI